MADRRILLPCQCVGTCSIATVVEWDADGEVAPEYALDVYQQVQCQRGWRDRLRIAWAVLRGGEPWVHGFCFSRDQARDLAAFLAPAQDDQQACAQGQERRTEGGR